MCVDLYSSARFTAFLVAAGIAAFGLFRAAQMGRGFVNRLYRARAFWTAALTLAFIVNLIISSVLGNGFGFITLIPFVGLVLALFVFADETIQAAIQMDFFHRNTLSWRLVRKPMYVLLLADIAYGLWGTYAGLTSSSVPLLFFTTILVALCVTIVAVTVSAGRTPDRTIKRHVRLFGAFLVGILVVLWTGQPGISPDVNLVSDLAVMATTYMLYLMTMSLSRVGRIQDANG